MNEQITLTRGHLLLLIAVVAYWVSPVDAMPGLPIDDLIAVWLAWSNRESLAPALDRLIEDMIGGGE